MLHKREKREREREREKQVELSCTAPVMVRAVIIFCMLTGDFSTFYFSNRKNAILARERARRLCRLQCFFLRSRFAGEELLACCPEFTTKSVLPARDTLRDNHVSLVVNGGKSTSIPITIRNVVNEDKFGRRSLVLWSDKTSTTTKVSVFFFSLSFSYFTVAAVD